MSDPVPVPVAATDDDLHPNPTIPETLWLAIYAIAKSTGIHFRDGPAEHRDWARDIADAAYRNQHVETQALAARVVDPDWVLAEVRPGGKQMVLAFRNYEELLRVPAGPAPQNPSPPAAAAAP